MKDFRVTKHGLGEGVKRFPSVTGAVRPSPLGVSFSGAINTGFSDWIGSRWGLAGASLMPPAQKHFRKEKDASDSAFWMGRAALTPANYRLLFTLRLTLALPPKSFTPDAKDAFVPAFSIPALPVISRQRLERERLMMRQAPNGAGAVFRLLSQCLREVNRSDRVQVMSSVLGRGSLPGKAKATMRSRRAVESHRSLGVPPEQTRAAKSLPSRENGRWVEFFKESQVSAFNLQDRAANRMMFRVGPFVFERPQQPASRLAPYTLVQQNAVVVANARRQVLHKLTSMAAKGLRLILPSKPVPALAENALPAPRLTFHTSRQTDAQAVTGRASRFATAPPLDFARREANLARGLTEALRDLRQSGNEVKAAAPTLSPPIDVLTRQVYDQFKRELRIEKERRGI